MRLSLFVLWAITGWCGTPWLKWWWRWPGPPVPGPPEPDPWPIISRIIGLAGGIVGGWAYTQVFGPSPEPWTSALPAAASALGAFLGGRLLTDIYGLAMGSRNVTRG